MATFKSHATFFFFFSIVAFSCAALEPNKLTKNTAIYFPIRKNQTSLQYYTTINMGNQTKVNVDALLDLGAQSVWIDCRSYLSTSYKRAPCGSNECKKAMGSVCLDCNSTPRPGCSNDACGVYAFNPYSEYLIAQELGEDTIRASSTDGRHVLAEYDVPKFQFSCADADIIQGLPGDHTKGLVGLARTQVSLASQISSSFNLPPKFVLCIPSSSESIGDMYIGGGPYYMPPTIGEKSLSFARTPLVVNPISTAPVSSEGSPSDEYFISVKHIEINGKQVSFNPSLLSFDKNGVGGTKISTIAPYTILHASIYEPLVKDFVKEATLKTIKRVTSVTPFGACFDSKTISKSITGPAVPDIDLVLEGNTISEKFTLSGSNLMVEAKKNVMCLAIVDGGSEPRTSIVLGGHQLENRFLEFDLSTSILGFTPSLLLSKQICSHSRLI
uniref:probable aspartic proteinase GIP2 n=1 Tax=Erigeron canadensis TaxID=72917 RepID=UPI001CB8E5C1|nr:probable aspartic proteinase GIP2 [Erigeron canadensis]